jgi:hypothetical protein
MGDFLRSLLGQQPQIPTTPGQPPGTPATQVLYPSGTTAADWAPRAPSYTGAQSATGPGFYQPDPDRPYASVLDIARGIPARALADILQIPTGLLEYGLGRFAEPGVANTYRNLQSAGLLSNIYNTEAGRSGLVNVPGVSRLAGVPQPGEMGDLPERAYSPEEQLNVAKGAAQMDVLQRRDAAGGGLGIPGTEDWGPTGATQDPTTGQVKIQYGPRVLKVVPRGALAGQPAEAPPAPAPAAAPTTTVLPAPSPTSPFPSAPVRVVTPGRPPGPAPAAPVTAGAPAAPGAAPGEPGAPPAAAPAEAPVRTPQAGGAPPRTIKPRGPSPAAVPQADLDAAHKLLGTTPAPPPAAPPPEGVQPGAVPAGGVPAQRGGPRTIKRGQTTYVEKPEPYTPDGAVLQSLRTDPKIDALVNQAGGDPDRALQDPVVGPQLQKEVEAAKQTRGFTTKSAEKGLESDVVVKRWLAAAKTARTAANELYGPITDEKGQALFNPETGQPYTFADVLTGSKWYSMMGQHLGVGPQTQIELLSKDKDAPYGLRQAARRILAGPTIRPKLAKATGEVGNLNTMEQTVFDSMIVTPSDSVVEGTDKRDLLFRLLDQQIALLQSGKVDPLTAANTFRRALGLPPRDHIATPEELAAEDQANQGAGFAPGPREK